MIDRLLGYLEHPVFKVGEALGKLGAIFALLLWVSECGERRTARHNDAWRTLAAAKGQAGELGRRSALRTLHADEVRLDGLDLEHAILTRLDLRDAKLSEARFDDSDIGRSRFDRAELQRASLEHADLKGVSFTDADLQCASLVGSELA